MVDWRIFPSCGCVAVGPSTRNKDQRVVVAAVARGANAKVWCYLVVAVAFRLLEPTIVQVTLCTVQPSANEPDLVLDFVLVALDFVVAATMHAAAESFPNAAATTNCEKGD